MTRASTDNVNSIENLAEGSPQRGETQEPIQPSKTTSMPAVSEEDRKPSPSETGMLSAIELPGEGRDDDEGQDASRIQEDDVKAEPKQQESVSAKKNSPVVLIVEDTMELAEVIQATLERMNMKTVHETHGERAINKLVEVKPDVVLLDISLPDMTGWKILDVIKEKSEDSSLKKMPIIIVITAYGDPANRLVGKLQGVYSYLIKPFTADEVERVVMGALSSATG